MYHHLFLNEADTVAAEWTYRRTATGGGQPYGPRYDLPCSIKSTHKKSSTIEIIVRFHSKTNRDYGVMMPDVYTSNCSNRVGGCSSADTDMQ